MDVEAVVAGQIAMVVTVLVGIVVLVWQGIVQGSKYDNLNQRLDGMYQHFDSKFDAQSRQIVEMGERLEARMDVQVQNLDSRIDARIQRAEVNTNAHIQRLDANANAQIERLDATANVLAQRLSENEREQARLEGVNSVLRHQMHQHEPSPSD